MTIARTFISGNRCDRPVTGKADTGERNLYEYKRKLILGYKPVPGRRGKIGLPLCLNMWELLPFWHTFFTKLGFAVYHSPFSSRDLYLKGQGTIPSDTACFPAKLAHGHIQFLAKLGLDAIFYPCMTYNLDEGLGDNHYNCPVVAYYPEVIAGNCPEVQQTKFIYDYVGLHRPKDFTKKIFTILRSYFPDITKGEVKEATDAAYAEYAHHMSLIRKEGERIIDQARAEGRRMAVVTSSVPEHCRTALTHLDLMKYFEGVTLAHDLGLEKKDPALWRAAAEHYGVAPEDCTVFDDSLSACKGARAAKMRVVGVYDGFFAQDEAAMRGFCDVYIRSFEELLLPPRQALRP